VVPISSPVHIASSSTGESKNQNKSDNQNQKQQITEGSSRAHYGKRKIINNYAWIPDEIQ